MLTQYRSRIFLSADETELVILNQKPVLRQDEKVEVDIDAALQKGMRKEELNELIDNDSDGDGLDDDDIEFVCTKSRTSCSITDIKSFLYGGFSSRFWMLRKHVNSLNNEQLDSLPFFNWECISLELQNRSVDLVIKEQPKMNMLLRYLIHTLRSIDGIKGSGEQAIKHIYREIAHRHKKKRFQDLDEDDQQQYWDCYSGSVYRKIYLKYQVLRLRSKISFEALKKCMTIKEIVTFAILKTYQMEMH